MPGWLPGGWPTGGDDARHWGPPFLGGESLWFLSANRNK